MGAHWNEAGDDVSIVSGELDEEIDAKTDVWADKIDQTIAYYSSLDLSYSPICFIINGVLSAALSYAIAEDSFEFWTETVKTFAVNFVIQKVAKMVLTNGNQRWEKFKQGIVNTFEVFENLGKFNEDTELLDIVDDAVIPTF